MKITEETLNKVVKNIQKDLENQDLTAIYELLGSCKPEDLIAFLPEESE